MMIKERDIWDSLGVFAKVALKLVGGGLVAWLAFVVLFGSAFLLLVFILSSVL